MHRLPEEEVTAVLGRLKSPRRATGAGEPGYRNGYGQPRCPALSNGTITVRRPRVRGLSQRLESQVPPLSQRPSATAGDLLPELYLRGLSSADLDPALRGLLGAGAPLSASTLDRLKAVWPADCEGWKQRPLGESEVVDLWVGGLYVKAGLEKDKAAVLVAGAGLRDGRQVVPAVESGARESTETRSALLRGLKRRGLCCPELVRGDGHRGIGGGLASIYPEAHEQRCGDHRLVDVLEQLPQEEPATATALLKPIPYADTQEQAEREKKVFQAGCTKKGCAAAGKLLDDDWDRVTTFSGFPKEHRAHLRTTNVIASPFATARLRTSAARRYKKVKNAAAVIGKTLLVAEKSSRTLTAAELLAEVAEGAIDVKGIRVNRGRKRVPA